MSDPNNNNTPIPNNNDENNRNPKPLQSPTANITPPEVKTPWQQYLDTLEPVKQEAIKMLAPKDVYDVPFQDGKTRPFKRKRIGTRQMWQMDKLRAKFFKETDVEKSTDIFAEVYRLIGTNGLLNEKGELMTDEEFYDTEWEDSPGKPGFKIILDTIAHRSTHGGAFFQPKP